MRFNDVSRRTCHAAGGCQSGENSADAIDHNTRLQVVSRIATQGKRVQR